MTDPTEKQRAEIRGAMAGCVVRTEHVVCGVDNLPDGRYVAVVQFTVTPDELRSEATYGKTQNIQTSHTQADAKAA